MSYTDLEQYPAGKDAFIIAQIGAASKYETLFRTLFGMQSGPKDFVSLSLLSARKASCSSMINLSGRGRHMIDEFHLY